MVQRPMQPTPPPPPDSWEVRRQKELAERERQKMARKRQADMERMNSGQQSNKMFRIEHGPAHETAGEMYRRIKAESKRPKSHAFRKGIMKGFSAAMLAQKAARDDIDKRMNDMQMSDSQMSDAQMNDAKTKDSQMGASRSGFMVEVPEGTPQEDVVKVYESIAAERQTDTDTELDDFRKQVSLSENQMLVRLYNMKGKSTGFGVVDNSPDASLDNAPDFPTLPNGQKPVYMLPDGRTPEQQTKINQSQAKDSQSKQRSADLSPAGRKLPDISHIKEPSREVEHAFEMAGSR